VRDCALQPYNVGKRTLSLRRVSCQFLAGGESRLEIAFETCRKALRLGTLAEGDALAVKGELKALAPIPFGSTNSDGGRTLQFSILR
jgi:hypothetical protein